MLRFFRFHAAYGSSDHPDAAGLAACIAARDGLDQLSRERVRMEMMKLVVAPHAVPTLIAMTDAGLLLRVLGGVSYLASFENMAKVEAAIGLKADPVRRLGALGVAVEEDAERLWQKLRLTNSEHERLASHGRTLARGDAGGRRAGGARAALPARPARFHRSRAARLVALGRDARTTPAGTRWRACRNAGRAPVFPLKAADFMARGVEKGPALGKALAAAEAAWIAAGFPADAATLAAIADAAANAPPA